MLKFFVFLLIALFALSSKLNYAAEYFFTNEDGEEVIYPAVPPYSFNAPGPWKGLEDMHQIYLDWHMRIQGLEQVRILRLRMDHPMDKKDELGQIKKIYIADKDNLIIGFKKIPDSKHPVDVEIWINGVINYIQVIAECDKHGNWRRDFHFKL